MNTREKVKEAIEVMTGKQIHALWEFIQTNLGIYDISTRTLSTWEEVKEAYGLTEDETEDNDNV